jgi:hypothetical protein
VPAHRLANNVGEASHTLFDLPFWQGLECFSGPLVDTKNGVMRNYSCATKGMPCSFVPLSTDGGVHTALSLVASHVWLPTSETYSQRVHGVTLASTQELHADWLGLQTWGGAASASLVQSGCIPCTDGQLASLRATLPDLLLTR